MEVCPEMGNQMMKFVAIFAQQIIASELSLDRENIIQNAIMYGKAM